MTFIDLAATSSHRGDNQSPDPPGQQLDGTVLLERFGYDGWGGGWQAAGPHGGYGVPRPSMGKPSDGQDSLATGDGVRFRYRRSR